MRDLTRNVFLFIMFITLINNSFSLFVYVNPKDRKCIYHDKNEGGMKEGLNLQYAISGESEEENRIMVRDPSNLVLYDVENKKKDNVKIKLTRPGKYEFCIMNNAKTRITLTFDFISVQNFEGIASESEVSNFLNTVFSIDRKLRKIEFNIKNAAIKKGTHSKIAAKIKKKINVYTIVKIAFLVIFSYFQIKLSTSKLGEIKVTREIPLDENSTLKNKSKSSYVL